MKPSISITLALILLAGIARAAWSAGPALTPDVQQRSDATGVFAVSPDVVIVFQGDLQFEADVLRRGIIDRHGIELMVHQSTEVGKSRVIRLHVEKNSPVAAHSADGYVLDVSPTGIDLSAPSPAGVYYGLQTLLQLMRIDQTGLHVGVTRISDWPDQSWRAAYLNWRFIRPGQASLDNLKALIRGFSSLKMNILVVDVADNLTYDFVTFPDRATPAFTKENLVELVKYARQYHVELVPYLQTISHVAWLHSNKALYEKLKEATIVGVWNSQYCPSNPQAVQLVHDMIEAQIDIFQPKYFHIGLDEVVDGPFATCPICSKKDSVALYRDAVLTICRQLQSHHIRPIIYNDAFTHRSPESDKKPPFGWEIIDQIPKDVLIDYWDYSMVLGERFESQTKWFTDKGFDLIGSSYQRPQNVASMPAAIQGNPRGKGIMLTFWNDVESWDDFSSVTPAAWATTTLSAMRGWKVQPADLDEVSQDLVGEFASAINSPASYAATTAVAADLKGGLNSRFGLPPNAFASQTMTKALAELSSVGISLQSNQSGDNAITLSGAQGDGLPINAVTIPINRSAVALRFTQTCDRPFHYDQWNKIPEEMTKKPVIGRYLINYTDGSNATIELKYNWNITDWNAPYGTFEGRIAYQGTTDAGARLILLQQTWHNPAPDKVIRDVVFQTTQCDGMSPVLLAMDAITPNSSPVMIDSFTGDPGQPDNQWRISGENFSASATAKTIKTTDPAHDSVLEVSLPKSNPAGSARLILDVPVKCPPDATQLSFWIHLSDPQAVSQSGIYIGNDLFAKNGSQFHVVRQADGWQECIVSLSPMFGAIKPAEVTQLRISLWVGQNQPANAIQLDDVQWITKPQRNSNLRTRWYR
jgi:hypothetical protein